MIRKIPKYIFFFLLICFFLRSNGQDSLTNFRLTKDGKIVFVKQSDHIHIINSEILIDNEPAKREINGKFVSIFHDSLLIRPTYIKTQELISNNMNGGKRTVYKHAPTDHDSLVHIKLESINKITTERKQLKKAMKYTFVASLLAFVASPLLAIENGKVNSTKARTIANVPLSTLSLSVIIYTFFGSGNHLLIPTEKEKKLWLIEK